MKVQTILKLYTKQVLYDNLITSYIHFLFAEHESSHPPIVCWWSLCCSSLCVLSLLYLFIIRPYHFMCYRSWFTLFDILHLSLVFIFNWHGFQLMKNPHISFMKNTLRKINIKFGSTWTSSFRGDIWKIVNNAML